MRKIVLICMLLAGIFVFTACSETRASFEVYSEVLQKINDIKQMDMDIELNVRVGDDEVYSIEKVEANLKQIIKENDEIDAIMELIDKHSKGQDVLKTYLKDNVFYINNEEEKNISDYDIISLLYDYNVNIEFLQFEEENVDNMKSEKSGGNTKHIFTFKKENMEKSLTEEFAFMLSMIGDSGFGEEPELIFNEMIFELEVDGNDDIKSYRAILDIDVKTGEFQTKVNYDITIKYNATSDVTLEFPTDLDKYEEYEYEEDDDEGFE